MHQDQTGFMWFGTNAGLVKYNCYDFINFSHDSRNENSISSNAVLALTSTRQDGNLWIGLGNGVLDRYDQKHELFSSYSIPIIEGYSSGNANIISLLESFDGNLWVGTIGNGLYKFDLISNSFTQFTSQATTTPLEETSINALYEDPEGHLWIGSSSGLFNYDPESQLFRQYLIDPVDTISDANYITSIVMDGSDNLLVGTESGELFKLERSCGVVQGFSAGLARLDEFELEGIISLFIDSRGFLWIGTWDGLLRYDPDNDEYIETYVDEHDPFGLSDGSITCIFEDRSGLLWFGTADGGINAYYHRTSIFHHVYRNPSKPGTLTGNLIFSICSQRSGVLWVGTTLGLDRLNPSSNNFQHYVADSEDPYSLSNSAVSVLFEDQFDQMWVGTEGGGLNRWDERNQRFTHYLPDDGNDKSVSDGYISAIAEDHSGNLWIGTQNFGLNRWIRNEDQFEVYQYDSDNLETLYSNRISAVYCDHLGGVWIGTLFSGLNKYDPQKDSMIRLAQSPEVSDALNGLSVYCIFEDSKQRLWVGTDKGLNYYHRETGKFESFSKSDGLFRDAVFSIVEDRSGKLWLSSDLGLSRFDYDTKVIKNFSVSDGLQGNRFFPRSAAIGVTGELFFGGNHGFNRFFPEQILDQTYPAPIEITSFKIFDQEMQMGASLSDLSQINLKYADNFFSFNFTSLDFTYPKKNQFAYRMEGFDKDWIYSGSRHYASYTNLNPGHYTFSVKGTNSDGFWNNEERKVGIYIVSPFWRTNWFIIGMILMVSGIVYALVKYRLKLMRVRTQVLQNEVKKQTADLTNMNQMLEQANVMKDLLLDIITHDLRNPIGVIEGLSDYLVSNFPDEEAISVIRESSRSVLRVMENATTLAAVAMGGTIDLEELDLTLIIEEVLKELAPTLEAANLTIQNNLHDESIILANSIIEEIFKNFVSNAAKYASAGQRLVIDKETDEQYLTLSFKDYGDTIPENQRKAVFHRGVQLASGVKKGRGLGLAIAMRIATAHGAEIGVIPNHPRGNIFFFKIPHDT